MKIDKRKKYTFVPTQKNILILQNMGYINKRGKTTDKNLNEFLNRAVYDKVGIESSKDNDILLERLILDEIKSVQKEHDARNRQTEKRLRQLAQKLQQVRSRGR